MEKANVHPGRCRRARLLRAAATVGTVAAGWNAIAFAGAPQRPQIEQSWRCPQNSLLPRRAETNEGARPWQRGLDKAFLDVDAAPEERLAGIAEALANPGEVLEAFGKAGAAIASRGLREGHPEAIDALWPKGTLARADLEGIAAVARQAPEVIEGLQKRSSQGVQPSEAESPDLSKVASSLPELLSSDRLSEAADELRNVWRKTPAGLEEPTYEVVRQAEGFELRRYQPFVVARRKMATEAGDNFASAEGFNALAKYLFGSNTEDRAMSMTMPVEISSDDATPKYQTMSFVLPAADASNTSGPPLPLDPTVEVANMPERLVAVKEFPGIATSGEVQRQTEKILAAIKSDDQLEPVGQGQQSVLQYNPPYTVPWRRRNEIAVVVSEKMEAIDPAQKELGNATSPATAAVDA